MLLIICLIITPLFFAFGWFAGRIDMKIVLKNAQQVPIRIFDALNALIENKTSIAVDELKQVAEQVPSIELSLILGKIFRKRGENDLAIKLHTGLLSSRYIFSNNTKDYILFELANDFQKAGLIDRAETILLQLLERTLYSNQSLEMLLLIYQQDKNWNKAIDITSKFTNNSFYIEVAQFNCELAQEAFIKSKYDDAINFCNKALGVNRKCVRANILIGQIEFLLENYESANLHWQAIEKQNHLYLSLVIEEMYESYLRLDMLKEYINLINAYLKLFPDINMYDLVYSRINDIDSSDLKSALIATNNVRLGALLMRGIISKLDIEQKHDCEMITDLIIKQYAKSATHKCRCCNFKAKSFFWQCPACYSWESINPNHRY